jgi:hypothetical protein
MAGSLWSNANTCVEIGFEILSLMEQNGKTKGTDKDTAVEKIADGVPLMSNDNEILIAVKIDTARQALSDTAVSPAYCEEKNGYLIYNGAAAAIPLFELARVNAGVREHIVSEESLRATLCGNYPEYVKTHNMAAPPGERIGDADAPPYLFLQKQFDNAADETRSEVAEFQAAQNREAVRGSGIYDDVLELESVNFSIFSTKNHAQLLFGADGHVCAGAFAATRKPERSLRASQNRTLRRYPPARL